MSSRATALVQLAPETYEFEEFPLPHLPEGSALVRIEANGMCGSDAESHLGQDPAFTAGDMTRFPRINGHEIVGVIEDMGPTTPSRRGFAVGDRVAVNPYIPCGRCKACLRGEAQM